MSDDDLLSQIIANAEQVAADVRRIRSDHSLSAQVRARDALSLKEAASAARCSDETVRRACVRTAAKKYALGFKYQERWFVEKPKEVAALKVAKTVGAFAKRLQAVDSASGE
jgi:hypothetical protein